MTINHRTFRDGVDITSTEFYQQATGDHLASTSQPSPGMFAECYRFLLERVDVVLSIHLTEKLSGTVRTAQIASEMFPNANIKVIDSQSTSMGLGGIVLEAARAAKRGMNFEEVVEQVKQLRERVQFLVALDTLEYVKRGGR